MINKTKPCGFHCLKIENLSVVIGNKEILKDINLHIHCGEITSVIGPNGAGKTTLLKAILDEIEHTGTISFKDSHNSITKNLIVGYVPQKINIDKNTPTSVYDLFASFNTNKPIFLSKNKKLYNSLKEQLKIFNTDNLIDNQVCDLSGGELQRVLLAIATYNVPNLLILDEPVAGVDNNGMELFYKNIEYLNKNFDLAIIIVSHDLEFVKRYSDNVILLNKSIIKSGKQNEIFGSSEFKEIFTSLVIGDN